MKQEAIDLYITSVLDRVEAKKQKIVSTGGGLYLCKKGAWEIMGPTQRMHLERIMHQATKEHSFPIAEKLAAAYRTLGWRTGTDEDDPIVFDKTPMLVCNNGTFDIINDKLLPHNPDHFATRRLDIDYDGSATCPNWLKMLDRMFDDLEPKDKFETIEFIQQWFGTSLVGGSKVLNNRNLRKGVILFGEKKTGKTTISQVLTRLFGKANVASPSLASLGMPFGMEVLLGKNALITDDGINMKTQGDASILKTIVTGEPMEVSRKFLGTVNVCFQGPVLFTTNTMPQIRDESDALYDRFAVIEMTRTFTSEDAKRDLQGHDSVIDLLTAENEFPGIVNWAIDGYDEAIRRKELVVPARSKKSGEQFRNQNDCVYAFVKECCDYDPSTYNESGVLARACSAYADTIHHVKRSVASTAKVLPTTAISAYPELKRAKNKEGKARTIIGLRLNAYGLSFVAKAKERGSFADNEKILTNGNVL